MTKKILMIDRKVRKYIYNSGIERILSILKNKHDVDVFWLLVDPDIEKKLDEKIILSNFRELEDYKTKNTVEILERENPDLILLFNDHDFLIRSFIPAAKFLKIPCVLLHTLPSPSSYMDKLSVTQIKDKFMLHKNKKIKLLTKFKIMIKNYQNAKYSIFKILKIIFDDFVSAITRYQPIGEYGCDTVLVSGTDWKNKLERKNLSSEIRSVGYITMDKLYEQITEDLKKKSDMSSEIKITLLTTPLVEHGLWTHQKWEDTLTSIILKIDQLDIDVKLSIKIHPTSEKIEKYQKLLEKLGINITIFQKENLYELIKKSDLIITYGYSSGTFEAVLLDKPVIVANFFKYSLENMPFVKEGIVTELTKIDNLEFILKNKENFKPNKEKLNQYIEKYIFKFDGNTCSRITDALMEKIN